MSYTPQVWVDKVTDLDVAHMTHIEDGIFAALPKSAGAADPITGTIYATGVDGSGVGLYMSGLLNITRAAAGQLLMQGWVGAEANPRFQVADDGTLRWGPGTTAPDTNLYRSAGNQLGTDGNLVVGGILYSSGDYVVAANGRVQQTVVGDIALWAPGGAHLPGLVFGNQGDTHLYRASAGLLMTDTTLGSAKDIVANRLAPTQIWLNQDGSIYFGSASDTRLYRSAAGILNVTTHLSVAGDFETVGGRLGQICKTISDWNNALDNGWYMAGSPINGPPALTSWTQGQVIAHGAAGYRIQRVWDFTAAVGSQVFERRQYGGAWGAWVKSGLYNTGTSTVRTDYDLQVVGQLFANQGLAAQIALATDGKIYFGSAIDTNLYRSGAGDLKTDGRLLVVGNLALKNGAAQQLYIGDVIGGGQAGILFGSAGDTNLYRSGPGVLKTDGILNAVGGLQVNGVSVTGGGGLVKLWDSVEAGAALGVAGIVSAALPATYKHLRIVGTLVSSIANNGGTFLRLNGDAATNHYFGTQFQARPGNAFGPSDCGGVAGLPIGNGGLYAASIDVLLPCYADLTAGVGKAIESRQSYTAGLSSGNTYEQQAIGLWNVAATAISTVGFHNAGAATWVAGTHITIYGMA